VGTVNEFIKALASASPVPGGGGASALIGAAGVSLCSMVANLTTGKKKYAEYQSEIEDIISRAGVSVDKLLELIEKDAEAFEPLSKAYGIPKDDPNREQILENALVGACSVPMTVLKEVSGVIDIVEALAVKGSKLVVSDVGIAASACCCAAEGAAMNVYINTKLMKNTAYANQTNAEAESMLKESVSKCEAIYQKISDELRCG